MQNHFDSFNNKRRQKDGWSLNFFLKTSAPELFLFKVSVNILQSLGFVVHVEKSDQPTEEIFLHLKPVKDLYKFKTTRSIRRITTVLDLIPLHSVRVKYGGWYYRRSGINKITELSMYYGSFDASENLLTKVISGLKWKCKNISTFYNEIRKGSLKH